MAKIYNLQSEGQSERNHDAGGREWVEERETGKAHVVAAVVALRVVPPHTGGKLQQRNGGLGRQGC